METRDATPDTVAPAPTEQHNSATPQRPEGNRLLDAPMVTMDLSALRQQLKREQAPGTPATAMPSPSSKPPACAWC